MVKNIIFDTDIGGDPDDFFALLLAHYSKEMHIAAIITDDEHEGQRATYVRDILSQLNVDIPVLAGIDLGNTRCLITEYSSSPTNSLEELKSIIDEYEYIHYFVCGAQSNLGRFVELYPEYKEKMELVVMGGNSMANSIGKSEHNVRYDIVAAQKVLQSGFKQKWITGDVTYDEAMRIDTQASFYLQAKNSKNGALQLLVNNCDLFWKKMYPVNYLHDPVALSTLIDPQMVSFEEKKMSITDEGYFIQSEDGVSVLVSAQVDVEKFMNMMQERIFE